MKYKRTLLLLAVAFLMVFSGYAGAAKIGGEITFWCMPNGPEKAHKAWLAKQAKAFEGKYGTKVNFEVVGWGQAFPKISTCVATGVGADVTQVGTTWNATFAATSGLLPLNINKFGGARNFMKAALSTAKYKGKYYGVPWFVETRCLVYNTAMFKKAGVRAPKTNTQLIAACKKLVATHGKGKAIAIVGTGAWDLLHNWAVMLWSNGGQLMTKNNKKSLINSAVAVETMEWYVDLVKKGYASKACAEYNTPQANAVFGAGNAAMAFVNTGDLSFLETDFPKLKFGIVAPPKGKVKRASFAGGSNLVIIKASANIPAAKQWIKFLTAKKQQISYCKDITKMLPGVKKAYSDKFFRSKRMRTFKNVLAKATAYPPLSVWGDVENSVSSEFSNILAAYVDGKLGAGDVQKFLDKAAKKMNAALAKEK